MTKLYVLLLFEDVSGGELILILLAIFLLFGPNKIPEIARSVGKTLYKFRKYTSDIQEEVDKAIDPIKKELEGQTENLKESLNLKDNPPADHKKEDPKKPHHPPAG